MQPLASAALGAISLLLFLIPAAASPELQDFETQFPAPWYLQLISMKNPLDNDNWRRPYRYDETMGSPNFLLYNDFLLYNGLGF